MINIQHKCITQVELLLLGLSIDKSWLMVLHHGPFSGHHMNSCFLAQKAKVALMVVSFFFFLCFMLITVILVIELCCYKMSSHLCGFQKFLFLLHVNNSVPLISATIIKWNHMESFLSSLPSQTVWYSVRCKCCFTFLTLPYFSVFYQRISCVYGYNCIFLFVLKAPWAPEGM